ncbi:MAG TPA: DegT/DnrJ/EryC1/StrS family aminotransferase, partial [Rubrivivax sp.]|nr:DegT/DnrJ/EryC1/StrS family aminotransferase [Rubrivivax sp.]
ELLAQVSGIHCLPPSGQTRQNHAYFPVLVRPEYPTSRDALYEKLRARDIMVRRYFYPLISHFPMYRGLPSAARANLPHAENAAQQVLCLPMYPALRDEDLLRVVEVIAG